MHVVWFKRDLRVQDHSPLYEASRCGACLCLYVYEPELIESEEFDESHLRFINQALAELNERLRAWGGRLAYRVGRMPDVLESLQRERRIECLWSHQETGGKITFDRDRRVAVWARKHGVPWREFRQHGVERGSSDRDGWSRRRSALMNLPLTPLPARLAVPSAVSVGQLLTAAALGLSESPKRNLQPGGANAAAETLQSFLQRRGESYAGGMSSPRSAADSCSRLSPYLAWGCLSVREATQALHERQAELREAKAAGEKTGGWLKSLKAFESRLNWRCHFMQKLEDEPSIEFENMSRACDGLREDSFRGSFFDAWCAGNTGYPLVDACLRALHRQSWINFRMRAMLMSFASYHLWLHWRPTAVFVSKHFLDFEPGIHYPQAQMQSGTTGINALRIYSPIKQVLDQDPRGEFIRQFVPELVDVPAEYIAEPHKMPLATQSSVGCVVGKDYPTPIVEHAAAYKAARSRMYAVRSQPAARTEAQQILRKHGSRKNGSRRGP